MRVSITLLQYEHGIIRQMVDCLKEIIDKQLLEKHRESAIEIHSFLTEYMDGFHHRKEERFIFPLATERSHELKEIADRLFNDHERARDLLKRMGSAIDEEIIKDEEEFMTSAGELVDHITQHIREEEDSAFPSFENMITVEEDQDLADRYSEFTILEFDEEFPLRSEEQVFRIENDVLGPGYYDGIV
jgi:hemerythrin-like domain-containing protein